MSYSVCRGFSGLPGKPGFDFTIPTPSTDTPPTQGGSMLGPCSCLHDRTPVPQASSNALARRLLYWVCWHTSCPLEYHDCGAPSPTHSALRLCSELQGVLCQGQQGLAPGVDTLTLIVPSPLFMETDAPGGGESGGAESHLSWPEREAAYSREEVADPPREAEMRNGVRHSWVT